jgi:small GTP-binding protein
LDGRPLDQVLIVERASIARLELHLHGAEAVLAALARAEPFEVAPLGPADRLLRHAMSDAQLRLALEQLELDFEAFLRGLAHLPRSERREEVDRALQRSVLARALAEPQKVVLWGAQNAGKSTLMNRLLARERALTGGRPGLTRDPVRELTCLDGYPYELVDTAGEGATGSAIDRLAQERGRLERHGALGILVVDGNRGPVAWDAKLVEQPTLVVCNKDDLPRAPWSASFVPDAHISCLSPSASAGIRQHLGRLLRELRRLPPAGAVGGVAALDASQEAALCRAREGDTSG